MTHTHEICRRIPTLFRVLFLGIVLPAVLVTSTPLPSAAQSTFGAILGTVRDRSGGVMSGVTVTLTNAGTNKSRTALTNDQGDYLVGTLLPGEYNVTAELSGFKKELRTGVALQL